MEKSLTVIEPTKKEKQKIRVAAYCRVSSNSDDQLHSFAAQVKHYTKFISENDMMELVDIYADEGLTGTKTAKRDDFNRLIADCKKGKIDKVFTKSVSRFARNTADSIMYARILKECGVSILFEKENIDTSCMSSELLLAISGAQAQEESISISKNMRWSCERRMKNGTFIASSTPYGYKLQNGQFQIVDSEAEIVRLIFKSYLSGMGKQAIANMLNEINIPKRYGYSVWRLTAIDYILKNERYIGDAMFQKTYTTDTLPFVHKKNQGIKPKYYVENTNPSIVSNADFIAVQELLKQRSRSYGKRLKYPLTQKIRCECGKVYRSLTVNGKRYWECGLHNYDSNKCNSRRIPEKDIYEAYITMVNKLRNIYKEILLVAISQIERLQMKAGGATARIKEIDREISDLNSKNLIIARLNSKGILRAAEYAEQSGKINSRVNELRSERIKLLKEQDENNILLGLRKLNEIISNIENPLTEFDEQLFKSMVNKITVPTHTSICFELLGGLKITESIPEQRRCVKK